MIKSNVSSQAMDDGGDDTVVHAWGPSLLRAGDAVEVFVSDVARRTANLRT